MSSFSTINVNGYFKMMSFVLVAALAGFVTDIAAQTNSYWNSNSQINSFRLPPPPVGYKVERIDLDKDGDPDILKSVTHFNTPILWIDDDDDMKLSDLEGDTDSDCLLVDKNRDGKYAHLGDLVVDWMDTNKDNKADMQLLVDYPKMKPDTSWDNGHYMWVLDTDKDNVFNYINWDTFELEAWKHNGASDFLEDYSGKSIFMKIHAATYTIDDLRLNWENPFLFYDPDKDGLTEIALRVCNSPKLNRGQPTAATPFQTELNGMIDWVSLAVDSDNDNADGNDFDYDFTLGFRGGGFDYMDQVHQFENMQGLPGTDSLFIDARWRRLNELIYPDHEKAYGLVFKNRKNFKQAWLVYDEDDDCNRWERVEFYFPLNPFIVGKGKGGIDNNIQSDPAGDRGEWDTDNSGAGHLYIGKFDGRLHLNGAEWGAWRPDQNAYYYQGWDRRFQNKDPEKFATVKYNDTDNNGFFDELLYDLNGDKVFEDSVSLKKLGISDIHQTIDVANFKYKDFVSLGKRVAQGMWDQAQIAVEIGKKEGLNLSWYAKYQKASSTKEKYNKGYWLQLYVYFDLLDLYQRRDDKAAIHRLQKAYYSSSWKSLK